MYERTWTARFSDTDPHGIVHYPRIVDAVHETSDMFMEEIGYPFWELTGEHEFGFPIVEIGFEFERPIRAGDQVTIGLAPDPGTRSVRFEYEAHQDDEVVFSGYEQRVCAPTEGEGGAIEIPTEIREAFEAYAD